MSYEEILNINGPNNGILYFYPGIQVCLSLNFESELIALQILLF